MITNNEGWYALRYYKQQQVLVRGTPTRNDYVFVVKANLSMAFIRPEDVDNLLSRTTPHRPCCPGGSPKKPAYAYASQAELDKWLGVE